tara:strand:+ start:330 stop:557 length:228 start_codon:yes stop_codon:yes gene_type:complete
MIDMRGPICDLIRFSHHQVEQNVKAGELLLELLELEAGCLHPGLTNKERPASICELLRAGLELTASCTGTGSARC